MRRFTNQTLWFEVDRQAKALLHKALGNGYILTAHGIRIEREVMNTLFKGYMALMNSTMVDGCVAAYHSDDDLDVAYALLMDEANRLITQAA